MVLANAGNGPLSVGGWFKPASVPDGNTRQTLVALSNLVGDEINYLVEYRAVDGTPTLRIAYTDSGALVTYDHAVTLTPGQWYHLFVILDTGTSPDTCTLYVNGVSQTLTLTGTSNGTPSSTDQTHAFLGSYAFSNYLNGALAEVVLTTGLWAEDDIRTLAAGFAPQFLYNVYRADWGWYFPLVGRPVLREIDPTTGARADVTGSDAVSHPPVYRLATAQVGRPIVTTSHPGFLLFTHVRDPRQADGGTARPIALTPDGVLINRYCRKVYGGIAAGAFWPGTPSYRVATEGRANTVGSLPVYDYLLKLQARYAPDLGNANGVSVVPNSPTHAFSAFTGGGSGTVGFYRLVDGVLDSYGTPPATNGFLPLLTTDNLLTTWSVPTGWTEAPAGTLTHTPGDSDPMQNDYDTTGGTHYRLTFTASTTDGYTEILVGGVTVLVLDNVVVAGTDYVKFVTALDTTGVVVLTDTDSDAVLSAWSLQEVAPGGTPLEIALTAAGFD